MNIKLNLTTEEHNNVIAAIQAQAEDLGYDENETLEDMIQIVDSALEAMGIECIWEDDDDEDFDEEEEYDDDEEYDDEDCEEGEDNNEEVYRLTPKGEFVALLLEEGGMDYDNALLLAEMFYNEDGELKPEYQDKPKVEEKTKLDITIYNENGHRVISKADADRLMEMVRRVVNNDKRIPMEDKETAANNVFLLYCEQELKVEGVMRE